jgi:hypothetical protein
MVTALLKLRKEREREIARRKKRFSPLFSLSLSL